VTARVFLVLAVLVAGRAAAEGEVASRGASVAVDFVASGTEPRWFVAALGELVTRELERFHAVTLAPPLDAARCPGRATRCLSDGYRDAGVDFVVLGSLGRRGLEFEVYDTQNGARAYSGLIRVAGVSTGDLQRHIGDIVRPIVQRGGLIDQRPPPIVTPPASPEPSPTTHAPPPTTHAPPATSHAPPATTHAPPSSPSPSPPLPPSPSRSPRQLLPLVFVTLMIFVALPFGFTRLLIRAKELRKRSRPTSWKWSALLAGLFAVLAFVSSVVDLRAMLLAPLPHLFEMLLPIVAGTLWGAVVLANASWLLAPIHGLGQIRHDALWSVLRAWFALVILRAVLLLLYAPVVMLTLHVCALVAMPERWTLALVLPAVGLLCYFWLLTLVDNLSLFLDVQLVIGSATQRNPWHGTIRRYLRGYVRRMGVQLDTHLFERTLFLPSLLPDVISYGGGFARPRVLVGEQAREATFGGLPEENEFPERTINPEELPYGFMVPIAMTQHEPQARAEQKRRELTLAPSRARAVVPRVIGESATLLGWVLPQPGGDGVPLIANTVEDFEVVKRLLTSHYAAFERNMDDDDVDDTDPTQKDFLFGALIREMGALARHDSLLATLWYSIALAASQISRVDRILTRPPIVVYERFLSAPAARVADAHVALNQGLHHLIQYLAFIKGEDEAQLTARADMPKLIATSHELLKHIERDRSGREERLLLGATPRNRVLWLSRFFHAPLASRSTRLGRLLGLAVALLVVGVALAVLARDAINYHPRYLSQMQEQAEAPPTKE
jgi:hypothetical protein